MKRCRYLLGQDAELADASVLPHGMTQRQHVTAVLLPHHLVVLPEVKQVEWCRRAARVPWRNNKRKVITKLNDHVVDHRYCTMQVL